MIKLLLGKYLIWVVAALAAMGYFLARHAINSWLRNPSRGSSVLESLSTRDRVIIAILIVWLIALVVILVIAS